MIQTCRNLTCFKRPCGEISSVKHGLKTKIYWSASFNTSQPDFNAANEEGKSFYDLQCTYLAG